MINFKKFMRCSALLEASAKAEKWLKNYTVDNLDKYPPTDKLQELINDYPYAGGKLYRGLNFRTVEQFNTFMENTQNGTRLETGSISSWTPDVKTAYPFAVTRPTYFLSGDLMQAESEKSKNRDYMIGHAGIILTVNIEPNVALDVNKSSHAKESEVILPPGTYNISIHKKYMPFMSSINADNFQKEFISIMDIDDGHLDTKKFEHIMFHYKDFTVEMKQHLYSLFSKNIGNLKYYVDIENFDDSAFSQKHTEISIGCNISPALILYFALLLPQHQKIIKQQLDKVIKSIDVEFKQKTINIDWEKETLHLKLGHSLEMAIKLDLISPQFYTTIKDANGKRYNALNSLSSIKHINSLSGKERDVAMKKYIHDLELIFKNIK